MKLWGDAMRGDTVGQTFREAVFCEANVLVKPTYCEAIL
jgi:hypothetical protein